MNYNDLCDIFDQHTSTHNRIGIMLSGGLDSAILLNALAKYKIENNKSFVLDAIHVDRKQGLTYENVNYVIETVERLTGYRTPYHTSGSVDSHHSLHVWSGVMDNVNNYDFIFSGGTKVVEGLVEKNSLKRIRVKQPFFVQPFFDCTKDITLKIAQEMDALESLSKITFSCTSYNRKRCGSCYWCIEREWAFRQINAVDHTSY